MPLIPFIPIHPGWNSLLHNERMREGCSNGKGTGGGAGRGVTPEEERKRAWVCPRCSCAGFELAEGEWLCKHCSFTYPLK